MDRCYPTTISKVQVRPTVNQEHNYFSSVFHGSGSCKRRLYIHGKKKNQMKEEKWKVQNAKGKGKGEKEEEEI